MSYNWIAMIASLSSIAVLLLFTTLGLRGVKTHTDYGGVAINIFKQTLHLAVAAADYHVVVTTRCSHAPRESRHVLFPPLKYHPPHVVCYCVAVGRKCTLSPEWVGIPSAEVFGGKNAALGGLHD